MAKILWLLVLAEVCGAQVTITVPGDHLTIQQAIDAAVNGDTVLVAPGVYNEFIAIIGKEITLRSESGPNVTHIVWASNGPTEGVVRLHGTGTTIGPSFEGFTVRDSILSVAVRGPATVRNCVMKNNNASGVDAITGTIYLDDCGILGNHGYRGDDISSLTNCGGGAPSGAAGGLDCNASSVFCTNCLIAGNVGGDAGIVFPPCTNGQGDGGAGGIYSGGGIVRMKNCALIDNVGGQSLFGHDGAGALEYNLIFSSELINCVVHGNSAPYLRAYAFPFPPALPLVVDHSNVEGYTGPGAGNIDTDPLLVDPMNGDYRLSAASPCIDAGDSTIPGLPLEDLIGAPRVVGADVDMGAYEYVPPLPGTADGLELRTAIDGNGSDLDRKFAPGGSNLVAAIEDDLGTMAGAVPVLLGQVFVNGTPPAGIPSFPLHLDFPGLAVFFDGNATPGPLIGAVPVSFGPAPMPPGLAGLTLRLQAFASRPRPPTRSTPRRRRGISSSCRGGGGRCRVPPRTP